MRTLYIDAKTGAAGDMLSGALLELLAKNGASDAENRDLLAENDAASANNLEKAIEMLNSLRIPEVKYEFERKTDKNISGIKLKVKLFCDIEEECADSGEEIEGNSHEHHEHRHLSEIFEIIDGVNAEESIKADAKAVYELLAEAESKAHDCEMAEVHFHEVGMLDAIADILAFCLLFRALRVDSVIVSPINVGNGQVRCAHGILPVPAPATAALLEGLPHYKDESGIMKELCTPTGAALLKYFADEFASFDESELEARREAPAAQMIEGRPQVQADEARPAAETGRSRLIIGHGMGTRVLEQRANCVTAYLVDTAK